MPVLNLKCDKCSRVTTILKAGLCISCYEAKMREIEEARKRQKQNYLKKGSPSRWFKLGDKYHAKGKKKGMER